jgi:hypothetical protein
VTNPKSDSRPFGKTIAVFQPSDLPNTPLAKAEPAARE